MFVCLKKSRVAIPNSDGELDVLEFETTTPELHPIADLLFNSILVDAKSVKNVPARKSDVQDAQWIQTLYSNGLLRAAFRPPKDRLPLREFVRQRQSTVKT